MRSVSILEFEWIDPGLLGRCAWEVEQARRDVELLVWVGRFRFVTAQAIGRRFGISWQQANARVRRLERVGLIGFERAHVSQALAVFLTGRGHELLGWPRRRAPRAQTHREHEEAIVWLATRVELDADAGMVVLTERECRTLEARDHRARYSVDVVGAGRGDRRRWPDLVVNSPTTRQAIEIEFAPKGTARLRRIVEAYERSSYDDTVFYVKSAALGRRIGGLIGGYRPLAAHLDLRVGPVRVEAWSGLPERQAEQLHARLAR